MREKVIVNDVIVRWKIGMKEKSKNHDPIKKSKIKKLTLP